MDDDFELLFGGSCLPLVLWPLISSKSAIRFPKHMSSNMFYLMGPELRIKNGQNSARDPRMGPEFNKIERKPSTASAKTSGENARDASSAGAKRRTAYCAFRTDVIILLKFSFFLSPVLFYSSRLLSFLLTLPSHQLSAHQNCRDFQRLIRGTQCMKRHVRLLTALALVITDIIGQFRKTNKA